MQTRQEVLEYYEQQSNKSQLLDALAAAVKEIEYLHNMMRRQTASGVCVLRQLESVARLVAILPENNFVENV